MAKYTVCEFLSRLTGTVWTKSFQVTIRFIQYFLVSTFVAVVIATLAECHPFDHYWQVVPDPGVHCRLGYANLLTMGVCDVITDLLLVVFPIPLVLMSTLRVKRKLGLVLLFALSMALVAITCYRVPSVIWHDGLQSYRSLIASLEILAATAVSNAIVIGSFVRDKGVKKAKFRRTYGSSGSDSIDNGSVRRSTIAHRQWGSDADLVNDLGIRLDPELQSTDAKIVRPAPVAFPSRDFSGRTGAVDSNWTFRDGLAGASGEHTSATDDPGTGSSQLAGSPRRVSFFDVGGLLDPPSPTTVHSGHSPTSFSNPQYRRSSMAFLQDVGGLLSPQSRRDTSRGPLPGDGRRESSLPHELDTHGHDIELHDPGGLLSQDPEDVGK
jgi:hypothetical protein